MPMFFLLKSVGDIPVCVLKYLRKVNCSGNPSFSAISLTDSPVWVSRRFAWLIVYEMIYWNLGKKPGYELTQQSAFGAGFRK